MKKLLSILLVLTMVCSFSIGFAEDKEKTTVFYDDGLSFAMALPEGYTLASTVDDGALLAAITSERPQDPSFLMVVAPENEYDGIQRLNDLSDEGIEQFALGMMEDLTNPYYEVRETGLGSKLIVLNEQNSEFDVVILASIYQGYLLYLYVEHADGAEVTQKDIDMGIQIYTDMDFITK